MNAQDIAMDTSMDDSNLPSAPRTVTPVHATHKFKLLLQREFWEHKGGFFWAPLVAGGISLLLTVMAIIVGLVAANRAASSTQMRIGDRDVNINGVDLGALTSQIGPHQLEKFGQGLDLSMLLSSSWPFIVLAFVVFFYCLGALYDERKDRSVLFWKSLPLSDSQTVLSKLASAALVAPALAVAAAILTMVGFMIVLSVVALLYGGNPFTLLWGPSHPLQIVASLLVWIPVYALWAMPTVGWLLLCSAWARSKPFLWAIMVPLFAGIFVTWFDLMKVFNEASTWFWSNIVGRMLLGTFPGMDLVYRDGFGQVSGHHNLEGILTSLSPANQLASLAMPQLWIGVIAGAAMIFVAIRLRRWRDEG